MRKMYKHLKKLVNSKLKDFTKTSFYSSFSMAVQKHKHPCTYRGREKSECNFGSSITHSSALQSQFYHKVIRFCRISFLTSVSMSSNEINL